MPFFPFLHQSEWKKVHDVSVLGSNVALLVLSCIRGEFRPPSQHSAVSNLHRHGGKTAEESQKEKDYYRNPWQHTKGARYGSSELYSIHCSLSLLIITWLMTLPVLMKPIQSDSLLQFQTCVPPVHKVAREIRTFYLNSIYWRENDVLVQWKSAGIKVFWSLMFSWRFGLLPQDVHWNKTKVDRHWLANNYSVQ